MKRMIGLLAVMVLVLALVCAATADGVQFKTAYFTLELPDTWITDMDDLESEEGLECLGFFGESSDIGIVTAAYLVYYENLKDIALWNSDDDGLQAYIDAILEDYAEDDPVFVKTVYAGKIPLVMIRGTDEYGDYLYADTMTNGYAIEFQMIVTDEEGERQFPITEEHIEKFTRILETFQPVTQ